MKIALKSFKNFVKRPIRHVKLNLESFKTIPKPLSAVIFKIWPEKTKRTFILSGFLAFSEQKIYQNHLKIILKLC